MTPTIPAAALNHSIRLPGSDAAHGYVLLDDAGGEPVLVSSDTWGLLVARVVEGRVSRRVLLDPAGAKSARASADVTVSAGDKPSDIGETAFIVEVGDGADDETPRTFEVLGVEVGARAFPEWRRLVPEIHATADSGTRVRTFKLDTLIAGLKAAQSIEKARDPKWSGEVQLFVPKASATLVVLETPNVSLAILPLTGREVPSEPTLTRLRDADAEPLEFPEPAPEEPKGEPSAPHRSSPAATLPGMERELAHVCGHIDPVNPVHPCDLPKSHNGRHHHKTDKGVHLTWNDDGNRAAYLADEWDDKAMAPVKPKRTRKAKAPA